MFPIIQVPDNAPLSSEPLGTKRKFWFKTDGREYLFKLARPDTGEDWSEKVAEELCKLINLPHASYDLAIWRGDRGVVSPKFVPKSSRLVHGNELLSSIDSNYPMKRRYRVREHILKLVLAIVKALEPNILEGDNIGFSHDSAVKVFVGYLMFDAWIGNQDRHHENWGIIATPPEREKEEFRFYLAPTYDHASSLGRNETDLTRLDRLNTNDAGRHITRYVEKATSTFYASRSNNSKPFSTLEAFYEAGKFYPDASAYWLGKLNEVTDQAIDDIFIRIPPKLISKPAIKFASTMLTINYERLMKLKEKI